MAEPSPSQRDAIDVTVVIPTYNRLWSLPQAVASCTGTKARVQIIVIDDGSTDGTWDWLQTQPQVTAMRQHNQGQTWAVNRGAAVATGEYIRFLDSDDYLAAGAIDRQLAVARATDADVVYSRVDNFVTASGTTEEFPDTPLWDDFTAVMLGEGYGSHYLGMLFRRQFVADIPRRPEFSFRDDRMFLLEVALRNPRLATAPGCAGYWVRHGRQMHTSYRGLQTTVAAWQMTRLYDQILNRLEAEGGLTPRRARAAAPVLWAVAHEISRTHLVEGSLLAKRVRQLDPQFSPPDAWALRQSYRLFGYGLTQRMLRLRRTILRRG